MTVSKEELTEFQKNDSDFEDIIRYIVDKELPNRGRVDRRIILESQDYVLDEGVLYHFYYPKGRGHCVDRLVKQLAVPHQLRDDVLRSYHDSLLGGHQGKDRTYQTIRYKYFWPSLHADISTYVQTCISCQRAKDDKHKHPAPLRPLPVHDVFSRVHLDLLGPLKTSPEGYTHVLVITCAVSKWTEAFPLKDISAIAVADIFFRKIICKYGSPDSILTDRGQQFMSKVLTEICKIFEITKLKTLSYRPQTNAAVERANGSILTKLRTYNDAEQTNWPRLLDPITFAMNTTIATESTQYSPYYLMFGRECRTPLDTSLNPAEVVGENAKAYIDSLHAELRKARELAAQNIEEAQEKYKSQHDKRAVPPEFSIRDKVWLKTKKKKIGLSPKLCDKWIGPFYIIADNNNNTYNLRWCEDNTELKSAAHADDLKPFHDPEIRPTNRLDPLQEEDEEVSSSDDKSTSSDNDQDVENNSDAEDGSSDDDERRYNVEKIINDKIMRGKRYFRIKWEGFSSTNNSWEPEENIPNALIQDYFRVKSERRRQRQRRN